MLHGIKSLEITLSMFHPCTKQRVQKSLLVVPRVVTVGMSSNILLQSVVSRTKTSSASMVTSTNGTRKSKKNANTVLRGDERPHRPKLPQPPGGKSESKLKGLQGNPWVRRPLTGTLPSEKRVDQLSPPVMIRMPIRDPRLGRGG